MYFLQDHLGSTVALTDSSGEVTEGNSYDSFGNPSNTNLSSRYQYTGREFDSFTGLQYSRARFYDPNVGRFISEDPIGFDGGDINLYGYVWNSPGLLTDPSGLDGFGNDAADWLDEQIEYAREYYRPKEEGDPDWTTNGVNNSVADVAHGAADMLRCGSGVGQAFFNSDENIYGRGVFTAMDVARCSALFATLAGPGVRFVESPIGCRANLKLTEISGREIKLSNDFRLAPLGNRTGHPTGEWPHYHRRVFKSNGKIPRGQGIDRHRPWDTQSTDKSFRDRF